MFITRSGITQLLSRIGIYTNSKNTEINYEIYEQYIRQGNMSRANKH